MVSVRESALKKEISTIRDKKFISINDLSNLIDCIEKVLMNYSDVEQSREIWKQKYMMSERAIKEATYELSKLRKKVSEKK